MVASPLTTRGSPQKSIRRLSILRSVHSGDMTSSKNLTLSSALEHQCSSSIPEDLKPMDPDTNLYYNRRTHRLEYFYVPSGDGFPAFAQQHLRSGASVEGQREELYGEITSYCQNGRRQSCDGYNSCLEGADNTSRRGTGDVAKEGGNDAIVDDRRDSGKDLAAATKTKHQKPIDELSKQTSTLSVDDDDGDDDDSDSSGGDPEPLPELSEEAFLFLDLRTQSSISSLPAFLSTRDTSLVQHLNIIHHIIESADVEEFASTHVAKTTFSTHGDGSISGFTHFELGEEGTECVCALEAVFRALIGCGEEVREPEHVQAKRRMWRRLSTNSKVSGLREQAFGLGDVARTPLLVLFRKFVEVLRPKLGSDLAADEVVCGLELFERPVCGAVDFGLDTAVHCTRNAFLFSGEVEGTKVDILGSGRRGDGRKA